VSYPLPTVAGRQIEVFHFKEGTMDGAGAGTQNVQGSDYGNFTLAAEDEERLQNWFTYHSPTDAQLPAYLAIRAAGLGFARILTAYTPKCADQTAAIRKIREAVMTANAAIACGGK
jgi:hypothetical protein